MKCEEKVAYKHRQQAEAALAKTQKVSRLIRPKSMGMVARYYRCKRCGDWHLTKQR